MTTKPCLPTAPRTELDTHTKTQKKCAKQLETPT